MPALRLWDSDIVVGILNTCRRQPVLRWWCGGGRSPRRLDKTIAPHPKYAYLILVFFFLFAFTNCPSPFWPQVAQIKHPLATNRLLPACLLVVRLPPLSVLRRLAQVPPLSVLRRLMEPLALLRGLLFVVGRPPLRLGAAPLVWVDWRHHPVLGPARRERSTRRGCWPACLRSWSSSVRSSIFFGGCIQRAIPQHSRESPGGTRAGARTSAGAT